LVESDEPLVEGFEYGRGFFLADGVALGRVEFEFFGLALDLVELADFNRGFVGADGFGDLGLEEFSARVGPATDFKKMPAVCKESVVAGVGVALQEARFGFRAAKIFQKCFGTFPAARRGIVEDGVGMFGVADVGPEVGFARRSFVSVQADCAFRTREQLSDKSRRKRSEA